MIKKFKDVELFDTSNAYTAVISLSNRNSSKKKDLVYLLWRLEDIAGVLKKHEKRYRDQFNEILKEFGTLQEENNEEGRPVWDVPPEKRDEYEAKILELKEFKIEFTCERLMLKDIIDKLEVSGGEIRPLKKIGILIKENSKPQKDG